MVRLRGFPDIKKNGSPGLYARTAVIHLFQDRLHVKYHLLYIQARFAAALIIKFINLPGIAGHLQNNNSPGRAHTLGNIVKAQPCFYAAPVLGKQVLKRLGALNPVFDIHTYNDLFICHSILLVCAGYTVCCLLCRAGSTGLNYSETFTNA